jgi:hypothetical protein
VNLQFKVACLLKNIWKMVQMHDIEVLPHTANKMWTTKRPKRPFLGGAAEHD